MTYRHTQRGWFTLVVFLTASLLLLRALLWARVGGGAYILLLVLAMVLVASTIVFSSLTVSLTSEELRWHFGPGWPRWRVKLSQVAGAESILPSWWWGYGIRITPHGWMYNVSGREAVLVRRRDGSSFILGTDEPAELTAAIVRSLE